MPELVYALLGILALFAAGIVVAVLRSEKRDHTTAKDDRAND